jgi:hypothetical protein
MRGRHMHSVCKGFSKECRRDGYCGWNDYFLDRMNLTLMTRFDEPGYVFVEGGPPKPIGNRPSHGIEAFVTELIVGLCQNVHSIWFEHD